MTAQGDVPQQVRCFRHWHSGKIYACEVRFDRPLRYAPACVADDGKQSFWIEEYNDRIVVYSFEPITKFKFFCETNRNRFRETAAVRSPRLAGREGRAVE